MWRRGGESTWWACSPYQITQVRLNPRYLHEFTHVARLPTCFVTLLSQPVSRGSLGVGLELVSVSRPQSLPAGAVRVVLVVEVSVGCNI